MYSTTTCSPALGWPRDLHTAFNERLDVESCARPEFARQEMVAVDVPTCCTTHTVHQPVTYPSSSPLHSPALVPPPLHNLPPPPHSFPCPPTPPSLGPLLPALSPRPITTSAASMGQGDVGAFSFSSSQSAVSSLNKSWCLAVAAAESIGPSALVAPKSHSSKRSSGTADTFRNGDLQLTCL